MMFDAILWNAQFVYFVALAVGFVASTAALFLIAWKSVNEADALAEENNDLRARLNKIQDSIKPKPCAPPVYKLRDGRRL